MKINLLCSDLSTNCTGRTILLAQALSRHYEVEIVGPVFGQGIWPPARGIDIAIRAIQGELFPTYLKTARQLLKLLDGQLAIACKPILSSLGIALLSKRLHGIPVILDVDDDELAMTLPGKTAPWRTKLREPNGYLYTRLIQRAVTKVDAVFCVSQYFQQYYGGVIVPHGKDTTLIDPKRQDRHLSRHQLAVDDEDIIIGFIGTPRPHKGIDLILEAMARLARPELRLMIVGADPDNDYVNGLRGRYPERMLLLIAPQPLDQMPRYLAASDLVVLPQRRVEAALGQIPAKLIDAMAMAKPIISTAVSDIPHYLDGCGITVQPDNAEVLAEQINWIIHNPSQATAMGQRARERFLQQFSFDAMLATMIPEIERVLSARIN